MTIVLTAKNAEKQIQRIPKYIAEAFRSWVITVEYFGIHETRKLKGYHDEPLKGARTGQRSIRLNRSYRAIYVETKISVEILVLEVTKHEY